MRLNLILLLCIFKLIHSFKKQLPIKFVKLGNKHIPKNIVPLIFYNSESNKVNVNVIKNNTNESSEGNSTSVRVNVDPLPTFPPFKNLCKMNFIQVL
jgi:hypothetical protein